MKYLHYSLIGTLILSALLIAFNTGGSSYVLFTTIMITFTWILVVLEVVLFVKNKFFSKKE